ncbi:MAG: hypothetical protein RR954_07280 [Christensenellaceae bacterium]
MKKTIVAIALAVLTVFAIAVPAMAATGETTVGIEVTTTAPVTVSCEVPLKLAFSVAADSLTVTVPKEAYTIKNNSGAGTAIKVSKMEVQGISGANWSLKFATPVTTGAADAYKMQLKLANTALPDLPAGATGLADMASVPAALKNVADGTMVPMALAATVGGATGTYTSAEALADQFKIIYTVAKAA